MNLNTCVLGFSSSQYKANARSRQESQAVHQHENVGPVDLDQIFQMKTTSLQKIITSKITREMTCLCRLGTVTQRSNPQCK